LRGGDYVEAIAIIQLVTVILPYFIKFLENAESLEELQELTGMLKRFLDNDDLPKILGLIEKLK
jgi:hypothetical protein